MRFLRDSRVSQAAQWRRIRLPMQETRKLRVRSLCQEDPLRRIRQPSAVFLLRKFHGLRNLAGYSPWGRKELNATEHPSIAWTCSQMQRCFTRGRSGTPETQRSARATGRGRQLPVSPHPIQHCSPEETVSAPPQSQRACSQTAWECRPILGFHIWVPTLGLAGQDF